MVIPCARVFMQVRADECSQQVPTSHGSGEGVGAASRFTRLFRREEQFPQVRLRRPARRESFAEGVC